MLPDIALLEIFYFCSEDVCEGTTKKRVEAWHTLVHVCRKWRNIVFGSPRHLNLRLCTIEKTPVRTTLDIWPPLPIVLDVYIGGVFDEETDNWDEDNIIAALEQSDRICEIDFFEFPTSRSEKILLAMQQPFPALTYLNLHFVGDTTPVQYDSFLGGSAPLLQTLDLNNVPFPGLPKLILSATHLVVLSVMGIPHSGYFSPEAIVSALSVLTSLENLTIGFESRRSRPKRRLPPETRTLLPILTEFYFIGVDKYLEDLISRIDAPLLKKLTITFLHQPIFDTAQLTRFVSRTPKLRRHENAYVEFTNGNVSVTLLQSYSRKICLGISYKDPNLQPFLLAQVCSSFFPQAFIPAVEHLYIKSGWSQLHWQRDIAQIQSSEWLDLLRPFSSVKCLYIPGEFGRSVARALDELIGDRATEAFPALQTLFLETADLSGRVWKAIGQFVTARQLVGHPIAVSSWECEPVMDD
jgi:hypothetical protein